MDGDSKAEQAGQGGDGGSGLEINATDCWMKWQLVLAAPRGFPPVSSISESAYHGPQVVVIYFKSPLNTRFPGQLAVLED